jgi:hypothetical protein
MTAPLHQLGRPGTTHDSHWLYIQGYVQSYLELLPHCSQGRTRQDNSSAAHPAAPPIRAIRQVPSTWTDMPLFSPFLPLARDLPPSAIRTIDCPLLVLALSCLSFVRWQVESTLRGRGKSRMRWRYGVWFGQPRRTSKVSRQRAPRLLRVAPRHGAREPRRLAHVRLPAAGAVSPCRLHSSSTEPAVLGD